MLCPRCLSGSIFFRTSGQLYSCFQATAGWHTAAAGRPSSKSTVVGAVGSRQVDSSVGVKICPQGCSRAGSRSPWMPCRRDGLTFTGKHGLPATTGKTRTIVRMPAILLSGTRRITLQMSQRAFLHGERKQSEERKTLVSIGTSGAGRCLRGILSASSF